MSEPIDRANIKADAQAWADLHRANTYQREGVKRVDALLAALEEAAAEKRRWFQRGADALLRAESAERRIAAVSEEMTALLNHNGGSVFAEGQDTVARRVLEVLHPVAETTEKGED